MSKNPYEHNPLNDPAYLAAPCPTPSRTGIRSREDHAEMFEVRCDNSRCPSCGPLKARKDLTRVKKRVKEDGMEGALVKHYAVTLKLRRCVSTSEEYLSALPKMVSDTVKAVRQGNASSGWSRADIKYMRVVHQGRKFPHVHLLLFVYADKDSRFPSRRVLGKRLLQFWNTQLICCLGAALTFDDPTGKGPGRIYFVKCKNIVGYVAYMLWNKGRPWQEGWPVGKGMSRVRCSQGLLPPMLNRQNVQEEVTEWLPGGVAYNTSRFRYAGYTVFESIAGSVLIAAPLYILQAQAKKWITGSFSMLPRSLLTPIAMMAEARRSPPILSGRIQLHAQDMDSFHTRSVINNPSECVLRGACNS